MSSKFFTWTKGDRRNASETLKSGGIVPIPAECITIKGMEYGRNNKNSSKASRKPIPLSFDSSPEPASMHSGRTNDSIALHDAAVQSATSLMHAMNDMLRSPQLSAHLTAQQQNNGLVPMYGRPRSRTAPSTPMVEAPFMEPVELPGSIPIPTQKSFSSLHQSFDGKGTVSLVQSPMAVGLKIERPHSSPQEKTYVMPGHKQRPSTSSSYMTTLTSLAYASPKVNHEEVHVTPPKLQGTSSSEAGEHTLVASETVVTAPSMRPSLSVLQSVNGRALSLPDPIRTAHDTSAKPAPQPAAVNTPALGSQHGPSHQNDAEAILMAQISSLRAYHEEHLSSLKDTHEKELASQRSYIAFLESRRTSPHAPLLDSKQSLTLDTTHAAVKHGELFASDTSATTLQSFESSIEHQKRTSQENSAETEALKRKLSLARKAQMDSSDIRRERDQLREAVDRSDRRIVQLKDIVRKAKDNEKSLRNMTTDLEARLVDANNARTDVLEGYQEACDRIREMGKRERSMTQEVEDLRSRLIYSGGRHASDTTLALPLTTQNLRPKHHRTVSDIGGIANGKDPLLTKMRELERLIAQKDARISTLEQEAAQDPRFNGHAADRLIQLETRLLQHQQRLIEAQADCERYNSLLHHELRRQSKHAAADTHKFSVGESGVFAGVAEEVRSVVRNASSSSDISLSRVDSAVGTQNVTTVLEKQLEHCFKEIIMYKLDIRGYKKDIKKAQAEIDSLQAMSIRRPPTPDRDSNSSLNSVSNSERHRPHTPGSDAVSISHTVSSNASGLGISLPPRPCTPAQSIASATAIALQAQTASPMPPCPLGESLSPPSRPKTPLGQHKRLPKPPPSSRTPSPLLPQTPAKDVKMQRAETLRSLSESIISSYAKRNDSGEHGSDCGLTPPSVGKQARSSDPLGPPVSRFASDSAVRSDGQ